MTKFNLLELPNPQLGDSDTLKLRTTIHQMKSGAVHSYVQGSSHRYLLPYSLTKAKLDAFEAFLLGAGQGVEVTFTDMANVAHKGAIVNNPFDIVAKIGHGDCALFEVTVEFEETV